MKVIDRLWLRRAGATALALAVAAGVILGVTTLLGLTFGSSQPSEPVGAETGRVGANEPSPRQSSPIARYPGFSFCVEAVGVDTALEVVAKTRVGVALSEVMQDPNWSLLRPGSPPPVVDIGCPSEPLIARPGVDWLGEQFVPLGNVHQYDVAEPSFYWTFVFLMPPEQISLLLGDTAVRVAPQEYVSEGDLEKLETTAIFVSTEELEDLAFLVKQLKIAVGLESLFDTAKQARPDAGPYRGVAICVQAIGVDRAIEFEARRRVETALTQVRHYLTLGGPNHDPPISDIGCPEVPLPSRPGIIWKDAQYAGGTGTLYTVPEPGPYNKFVFIMPLEQIDTLLGGLSIRHAPQDYVSDGSDVIGEVASGTYITPEELQDLPFLVKHLTIAVGLEDHYPEPPPE